MKQSLLLAFSFLSLKMLLANGPVAVNDTVTVHQNFHVTIPVTQNDIDPNSGALTINISFPSLNGTTAIVNGNQVLYTPTINYSGPDSFTYTVCDTFSLCASASVYITVGNPDLPPMGATDNYTFSDSVVSEVLNVLANDRDPQNDSVFITTVFAVDTIQNLGSINLDSTGQVIFTRTPFSCGTQSFEYAVCNISTCDTVKITINITCPSNIFLPQGISPNGDGKNDVLDFVGLEYFTPATLKVFNPYGTVVYESDDYKNDWQGTELNSTRALPDGTYFYVLQLPDKRSFNNYLIINR
ncbi:MAG: thrombospondin [Bacteroidota bacterium]|nr:thrombospondin [Bacteroidota bacterium]